MSEPMSMGVDPTVVIHRNADGDFTIEHRPDADGNEPAPLELVMIWAREALDDVNRDIKSYTGGPWEGEMLPDLRREQEFLERFLRVHSA